MKQAVKKYTSFEEFASEELIIGLLCRERAKYAVKNHKRGKEVIYKGKGSQVADKLWAQLKPLMPPRDKWVQLPRNSRPGNAQGIQRWTHDRKLATARVEATIKAFKDPKNPKSKENKPWEKKLDAFVKEIRAVVGGKVTVSFDPPEVIAKEKKVDKSGTQICRPICVYKNLKDKILITLAQKYIVEQFDQMFGRHMLFMRGDPWVPKDSSKTAFRVPNYLDAIYLTSKYREQRCNAGDQIWVGECDIQKFYDIFNHDVIIACFEALFVDRRAELNAPSLNFKGLESIIKAYLESFNFPKNISSYNDNQEDEIWKSIKAKNGNLLCKFDWVDVAAFTDPKTGCYTQSEFDAALKGGKIGVPQGGALSGIIVNVVMRQVDKPVLELRDKKTLFIRYCDDILLMHPDRLKCAEMLAAYERSLKAHKLVPHPFKSVPECRGEGKGEFWHQKSKKVYRWGPGWKNNYPWVGFVGYEMHYDGSIRLRKDKVDEELKHIASLYHKVAGNSKKLLSDSEKKKQIDRFSRLSEHFAGNATITFDEHTLTQAHRLDNYLIYKAICAAHKLGVKVGPEDAASFTTYEHCIRENM